MINVMRAILRIGLLSLLGVALAGLPTQVRAQSTTNKPAPAKKAAPETKEGAKSTGKQQSIPYHGNLVAVDKAAGTLTVSKRTFQITSDTKFFKGEKTPATLNDGVVGEPARLSYKKTADGKYVAHNVYFGAKPEKSSGKSSDKPKETTDTTEKAKK